MKVKAYAHYGYFGSDIEFEEEFDDDATDEEIEEFIRDTVFEQIEYYWEKEEAEIKTESVKKS